MPDTLPADFVVRLARLPVNWQDNPDLVSRYWDEAMTAIEKTLNAILAIPVIQDALVAANQAIVTAQQAANTANAAAQAAAQAAAAVDAKAAAQAKEASLVQSYVVQDHTVVLTGQSNGVVVVADHHRVYGDSTLNPPVAVKGANITTNQNPGSVIRVYYSDPQRKGGVVNYQFTVDPDVPKAQTGDIHSVGVVTIPTDVTPRTGKWTQPPGYIDAT